MKTTPTPKLRFWSLLGVMIGAALIASLLYTLIGPGMSLRTLSDSLCTSALFLGILSALPLLFDVGRGMGVAAKMGGDPQARQKVMDKEHQRREQGMVISFALIAATVFATISSLVLALM